MSMAVLLAFAAASGLVVATPGPTVLLALRNGAMVGLRRASIGIIGAACSDLVLIAAVALGLGAVLAGSAVLFTVLKLVGAVYLIWLGVQMIRGAGHALLVAGPGAEGPRALFRRSFVTAVTNPKAYLFFAAFLPQFLSPDAPLVPQYAMLAAVFVIVDMVVMALYAGFGAGVVRGLGGQGAAWAERLCGGTLVTLGAAMAFLRRGAA